MVHADSTVVFNEIMYHPPTNEALLEWVELYNQQAVDMDLSGWSLANGISFQFAEGTILAGGGHLVVASSPATLKAVTGLTNIYGPFTGRLSNAGETLELRDNNNRLMDSVAYGTDGDWPVGPDGGGVSLAKRDPDSASAPAESWTVSAQIGGTPGARNFPVTQTTVTNSVPIAIDTAWKYDASGSDLGTAWRGAGFDDHAWPAGKALLYAGNAPPPPGVWQPIPTLFSTGLDPNGNVLAAGTADPHYLLTLSAQGSPPPPPIAATVIQNHPAWLANDAASSWIGPVNPGTANVAPGSYNYRTTFDLSGFDPRNVVVVFNVAVDNNLNDVLLNGVSAGINFGGFTAFSANFTLTNGFVSGINTLDFLTLNASTTPNPAGFRARLNGMALKALTENTAVPLGPTTYYFRTQFNINGDPHATALLLHPVIDDGAVFYLNGAEVFRYNLPGGPVTSATFASTNVAQAAFSGPFPIASASLAAGANVLAVEVHKAAGGNDMLFGAELLLTQTNFPAPPPPTLAFNELASSTNSPFWLEIINDGGQDIALDGFVLARLGGATNREYVFPGPTLPAGSLLQVTEATLGFGAEPGAKFLLYSPGKSNVLDAVVPQTAPRARHPDGSGPWLFPDQPTPGASNSFAFHDEIVINEIMYHHVPMPATPATYGTNLLLTITNRWRYNQQGVDLGAAWRAPDYDDSAWPAGSALLYFTSSTLPALKNTQLSLTNTSGVRLITWYFRTEFVFDGDTNGLQFNLHPIIDDGAVFYLNGAEVFRLNMPAGPISYTNFASAGVATATYTGPFTIPASNLTVGTNVMAVEVHQFTLNPIGADVVFGTELAALGQLTPATPFQDSPESWLELFNRSTNVVDLTNWRLDGGVRFNFPAGTTMAPGAYLVVAKDANYLRALYPAITILGNFAGALSHTSDQIVLRDPSGNPANQLTYFDAGRWPGYADAGGSSLELRDPFADNSKPEAWAASVESTKSSWSNYTWRGVAVADGVPPQWNELVMCLISAGECLLDDVSVIDSPSGAATQLIQNGSFENGAAAWRLMGTHSHSEVITDPDNPGNHVLHVVGTGYSDYETMHNHLETTLANGATIVNGHEYQISFRARWLAGANLLNTRLYWDRLARTVLLPLPALNGTPGARNSRYEGNIGPVFAGLHHTPPIPQPNQPVTVSVTANDPQGVSGCALWWAPDGGAWSSAAMTAQGNGLYVATLPGFPAATIIHFYVQATDGLGVIARFPAGGTNSRALYIVNDGQAAVNPLHNVRIIMLAADANLMHAPTNVMGEDLLGATAVYDERQVFYDVGVHLQGSERGRNDDSRVGFTIKFHPDELLRGVQSSVSIDRSGGYSGLGGRQDEIMLKHAINHAGGIAGMYDDLIRVIAPRSQDTSTALLLMARFTGEFLSSQYAHGGGGGQFKLELVYYPLTTVDNNVQSWKLPQPDNVIGTDIQDLGNDKEAYRWYFLNENNVTRDDYTSIIALAKAFSLSGPALEAQAQQLMDVSGWMRAFAMKSLSGDADTYGQGYPHNLYIYFRPDDQKSLPFLWDQDFAWTLSPSSGLTEGANISKIIAFPENLRLFYCHLLDLITTTYNSAYMARWAAHYGGLVGQNYSGVLNYIGQRGSSVLSQLPPPAPFAITSNNGINFVVSNNTVTLAGTAPITVKTIEVNNLSYPVTWTSISNWTLLAPLAAGTNWLTVRGLDLRGALLTNAVATIIVTNRGPAAPLPVVINEWMAGNAAPGGFPDPVDGLFQDWFELYNPNPNAIDLSGYFFTDALLQPRKWAIPAGTVIEPRGFLLVWADNETNQNALDPNGALHAPFKLNRGGEAIGLFAPDGITPQSTAVFGPQIQNVSQGLFPDGNTNTYYFMTNFTPRAANTLAGPLRLTQISFNGGVVTLRWTAVPGHTYRVQFKDNLSAPLWSALGQAIPAAAETLSLNDIVGTNPQRIYRVMRVD